MASERDPNLVDPSEEPGGSLVDPSEDGGPAHAAAIEQGAEDIGVTNLAGDGPNRLGD